MGNCAKIATKTREAKKENTVSQTCKSQHSQFMDSPVDSILHLQALGNQAMQRMIQSGELQAKLTIGQPGDKYEQEADRGAEQVMCMPEPQVQRQPEEKEEEELQTKPLAEQITPLVQRQTEPEEEEKEKEEEDKELQAKAISDKTPEVTPTLESRIQALKGGGQPLPESIRAFFEPRFGQDFSQVRVHNDARAAETARTLYAKAFTVGRDIGFGPGQYSPETSKGQQLLAHELTHVVQQTKRIQPRHNISHLGDKSEQQANRMADEVMRMTEPQMQRQPEKEAEIQSEPLGEKIALIQRQPINGNEEEEPLEEVTPLMPRLPSKGWINFLVTTMNRLRKASLIHFSMNPLKLFWLLNEQKFIERFLNRYEIALMGFEIKPYKEIAKNFVRILRLISREIIPDILSAFSKGDYKVTKEPLKESFEKLRVEADRGWQLLNLYREKRWSEEEG